MLAGLVLFVILYLITIFFPITLCPIRNIFGFPCFGCGLTRGFVAIIHLNFKAATKYHVLSIPLFVGILVYAILCISDILFDRNDLEHISDRFRKKYMLIIYLIILAVSAYLNNLI